MIKWEASRRKIKFLSAIIGYFTIKTSIESELVSEKQKIVKKFFFSTYETVESFQIARACGAPQSERSLKL